MNTGLINDISLTKEITSDVCIFLHMPMCFIALQPHLLVGEVMTHLIFKPNHTYNLDFLC